MQVGFSSSYRLEKAATSGPHPASVIVGLAGMTWVLAYSAIHIQKAPIIQRIVTCVWNISWSWLVAVFTAQIDPQTFLIGAGILCLLGWLLYHTFRSADFWFFLDLALLLGSVIIVLVLWGVPAFGHYVVPYAVSVWHETVRTAYSITEDEFVKGVAAIVCLGVGGVLFKTVNRTKVPLAIGLATLIVTVSEGILTSYEHLNAMESIVSAAIFLAGMVISGFSFCHALAECLERKRREVEPEEEADPYILTLNLRESTKDNAPGERNGRGKTVNSRRYSKSQSPSSK
jgi:hypothetical protein